MGMGMIIFNEKNEVVYADSKYINPAPNNSNNVAEYAALYYVLKWLADNGHTEKEIMIKGDSKLVIMQMSDKWKIKNGMYRRGALYCKEFLKKFNNVKFRHIPRELNMKADSLSTKALKERNVKLVDFSKLK